MELAGVFHGFLERLTGPEELNYWLLLVFVWAAVDFIYRFWTRRAGEPFWTYSVPWRIYTHGSARLDYKFLVVRKLTSAALASSMLVSAAVLGAGGHGILTERLGPGPGWVAGVGTLAAFAVIQVVLFDIGHYISHYLQHKVPILWEFHKVHHAAEVLTPVTAFRAHPVEAVVDSVFEGPLQAVGIAVFYYVYGAQPAVLTLAGIGSIHLFHYLIDSLRHTHVWISFGPFWEHVLSSPAQHQIHHSKAPQHVDRNFAHYFSFLDWMGGTLCVAKHGETVEFGLSEGGDAELNSVWGLYWAPVKRAARRLACSITVRRS